MRKYTVYEIEKLTNGKLTKYKLNMAIQKGELDAEFVNNTKRGRGLPKYYVYEDALEKYLQKITEERKRRIVLPGEDARVVPQSDVKSVLDPFLMKQDAIIEAQDRRIRLLEERLYLLEAFVSGKGNNVDLEKHRQEMESQKIQERQSLISELQQLSPFATHRRDQVLERLYQLS